MNFLSLPVVKRKITGDFSIFFYEEFESLIFNHDEIQSQLLSIINFTRRNLSVKGFRREICLSGFPFLVAVRPEEKALYLGTRRLSRELSILKMYENNPHFDLGNGLDKVIFSLKEHTEKISSVSTLGFPTEIEWITQQFDLPNFLIKEDWKDVDENSKIILKNLIKKVGEYQPSFFEKISDYGLGLTAQFDLIRVHVLKFLALLPSLDHDKNGHEVKRNLLESLRRLKDDNDLLSQKRKRTTRILPWYLSVLFSFFAFFAGLIPAGFLAGVVRSVVKSMAKRFIAGESIHTSEKTLRDLKFSGREATLDQLGELVVSSREADEYFEKVLQLIHGLKQHYSRGEKNAAGILKAHVSIKVSALSHDFRPQAFESTYQKVAPRLKRILLEAAREEVFINIDAEHYHYRDIVFKIYSKVLLETKELNQYSQTGIVLQAYLRDAYLHLKDIIDLATKRGLLMPLRLVKGAYWDAETIEAEAHQFMPPQFLNKEESDLHFRQLAYMILKNGEHVQLAMASHNLQDHAFVEAIKKLKFPSAPVVEHQCLHMTYEALSNGLALMNWPTRNYMPIGNLLVGMAYLVRRIMENSSQVGILSIMRSHQKAAGLISPVDIHLSKKSMGSLKFDSFISQLSSDFSPVIPSRLYIESDLKALNESIGSWRTYFETNKISWQNSTQSKLYSNSEPDLILGLKNENTSDDVQTQMSMAKDTFIYSDWSKPHSSLLRISIFLKAADRMVIERARLAGLIMFEAGKTMTEALADVDEAIDFINYYCRQEIHIQSSNQKISARGIFAVIAPWNFPLAIPCGMTVAPLIAGNIVLLKPAEQTPLIAREFYQILLSCGLPDGVLYLIEGEGEVVGAPLVKHSDVAGIVFTGSKQVGKWIYQASASKLIFHETQQSALQKKIITEMGGKNAIIVTNNCELDETISGIMYSAFGHAGQKCSAASRIIVHSEVKSSLVNRLKEAVKDLKVGSALDPATSINPLVSEDDVIRVRRIVDEAKDEVIRHHGNIIIDRSFEKNPGHCVGPVILELPIHQARKKDSWAQREIFAPVLHIIEYSSLMEAIELFNSTEYALTGGIYSQSQDDIDFLLKFLRAGNIYVNRPNTGARVAIEPFGGFKLSGTGPKAGGSDYLQQFHCTPPLAPQSKDEDCTFAASSGYQLMKPKPSLISITGRLARFNTFSSQFLLQYEQLLGHVNERDKAELGAYSNWIKDNLHSFLMNKHPNHTIPGQLSYNDKSLVKDSGLFVIIGDRPSCKLLAYLFSTLSLGTGLSVACLTTESYTVWKGIIDLAWKSGFSKTNLDISLLDSSDLNQLLSSSSHSFIYADRLNLYTDTIYKDVLSESATNELLPLLLSDYDGLVYKDFSSILDLFVWTRSFAINTMRHGAPLELGL